MPAALEERAYSIAALPKPFDRDHGQTHLSAVQSIRGSKKRKRHEVVVGIDGESLNIYNVRSQNLLASYALPPQSFLCCPPCSVYTRSATSASAQRRTYLVIRDGMESKRQRLVCFTENTSGIADGTASLQSAVKSEHELEATPIVGLDVLPSNSTETGDRPAGLLVSYESGRTTCMLPDLSRTAWTADYTAEDSAKLDLSVAIDADDARKGLLLGREDVLASSTSDNDSQNKRQLLVQLLHTPRSSRLLLHAIRTPSIDQISTQTPGLQLIMQYEIPSNAKKIKDPSYDLHAASGKLLQLDRGRLNLYDLSGIVPKLQFQHGSKAERVKSFTRVSSSSVLAVVGEQARVFETRYGSIQRVMPLQTRTPTPAKSPKRKATEQEFGIPAFRNVTYFPELGLLVGTSESELSVAPIAGVQATTKRTRTRTTTLADVHAESVDATPLRPSRTAHKAKLDKWLQEVDSAVQTKDLSRFEHLAAEALRLKAVASVSEEDRLIDTADLDTNSFDLKTIDKRRVLHVLSKCFRPGDNTQIAQSTRLVISLGTQNVFRWLAVAGYLDRAHIQQAFAYSDVNSMSRLLPGDLMHAISRFDNDFSLVFELLATTAHWDVDEVVQALQLLAQSFETGADNDHLALPAPHAPAVDDAEDEDMPMTNGDLESHLASESLAAEKEFDHAMSTLDSGLQIRSDAFRLTLRRLHAFSAKAVTAAMRSIMSHRQLIFFIHIMRIELSDGGWITRYTDLTADETSLSADETPLEPDNRAIRAIADVLNCAIDAIGTSGWLVGLSGTDINAEELVNALRAEINACLEGSYEAVNLDTMIDELERYAAIAADTNTLTKKSGDPVLPVGLRVEAPTVHGRINQSALDKKAHIRAMEKNRRVGKYTFERIRV